MSNRLRHLGAIVGGVVDSVKGMMLMESGNRSVVSLFAAIMLAVTLSGCAVAEKGPRLDPFAAINPFQKFDPLAPPSPLAAQVVAQWETELARPDFLTNERWHTRPGRDELIYRLILMSDYRFNRYESDLVTGKATRDTFVDLAVLGLNAAGVFVSPGQATRVLAAISGGLISSRSTIEKNFYQNQAQGVLLRKMKVLRAQKLYSISRHLLRDNVDRYPVERALIDVLDYYNRGTMLGALDAISQDTAAQEIEVQGGTVTRPPRPALAPGTLLPLPTTGSVSPPVSGGTVSSPDPVPLSSDASASSILTPEQDPLHSRKAALQHRVRRLSADAAMAAATSFVPTTTLPKESAKRRLQVVIGHTHDADLLTRMETDLPH